MVFFNAKLFEINLTLRGDFQCHLSNEFTHPFLQTRVYKLKTNVIRKPKKSESNSERHRNPNHKLLEILLLCPTSTSEKVSNAR